MDGFKLGTALRNDCIACELCSTDKEFQNEPTLQNEPFSSYQYCGANPGGAAGLTCGAKPGAPQGSVH